MTELPEKPNIIIMITDQERELRGFPRDWVEANLPTLQRLKQTGMTYTRMHINTTPCWATRSVLFSGYYPLRNRVININTTLNPHLANLARILEPKGYRVVYKGKWGITNQFDGFGASWGNFGSPPTAGALAEARAQSQMMAEYYGMREWNGPEDATADVTSYQQTEGDFHNLSGGVGENDQRYVTGVDSWPGSRDSSALEFLRRNRGSREPYCLIISLGNPHDVSVFPYAFERAGYRLEDFIDYDFELPRSYYEDDLQTKPWIQLNFLRSFNNGPLVGPNPLNYLKFYAYLQTLEDRLFGQVLDAMTEEQRAETLIIRTADHGELGMSHGGLQQKWNNMYAEQIDVPLIFSNPVLFPEPRVCDQLVSTVDILPTLDALTGEPVADPPKLVYPLQGKDFSGTLTNPDEAVQDAILYTYFMVWKDAEVEPSGNSCMICGVVTKRWKYAVYFAPETEAPTRDMPLADYSAAPEDPWIPVVDPQYPVQYELYDLDDDPDELDNLLPVAPGPGLSAPQPSAEVFELQVELHAKLTALLRDNDSTPSGWWVATPGTWKPPAAAHG